MQIFVRLSYRTITLEVEPSDTVEKVKRQIEAVSGIPTHVLRLTFANRVLYNANTLRERGISEAVTIHLYVPPSSQGNCSRCSKNYCPLSCAA